MTNRRSPNTFRPSAVDQKTAIDGVQMRQWFLEAQQFLTNVTKLDEVQTFTQSQRIQNATIHDSAILLQTDKFTSLLNINKTSSNLRDAKSGGGNAALYIQHLIDNSIATRANVNVGARIQVESYQQRASAGLTNDLVGAYIGTFNGGVDVGQFGIHCDTYAAGTGANTTAYGFSSELYRTSAVGFTVSFHARSIDSTGYLDNDYGFLASPSAGGALKFKSIFAGGSTQTGTMKCDYGLDLRQADAAIAAISIPRGTYMEWDGNAGASIRQKYDVVGEWQHYVSGVKQFGLENTGRLFIINNANTVYGISGGASGNFLAINIGGTVYKIQLNTF